MNIFKKISFFGLMLLAVSGTAFAEVSEETVTVDFNHPLSGRTIHFKVKIARVEPAELH